VTGKLLPFRTRLGIGLLTLAGLTLGLLAFYLYGTSTPTASGTVRLDGQPLPTGRIRFVPLVGTPGPDAGAAIEEGKYRVVKGLQVGEYRVEIEGTRKSPKKKVADPFQFGSRRVPEEVEVIPPEYNQQSKIIRKVDRGTNTFDFELEEAKGKGTVSTRGQSP
jgi:hypothetical protein